MKTLREIFMTKKIGVMVSVSLLALPVLASSVSTSIQWEKSEWISAADAPVFTGKILNNSCAASGTSWFISELTFDRAIKSAKWTTTGLGVYELYVNGRAVGAEDVLKPGFTNTKKTRRAFTYDVTEFLSPVFGDKNILAAEVSSGWWRDKIVHFAGKKSAFRSILVVTFVDGTVKVYGTNTKDWKAGVGGPVVSAGIYDGETYDARTKSPHAGNSQFKEPEINEEFAGEILPSQGGEICRRYDKELQPIKAYVWKGVDGEDAKKEIFGRVHKLRDVVLHDGELRETLFKGETLIVDFGQNCAAVPSFVFKANEGTVLTCLPGEMLNDANGERSRGNDGPGGSIYRENLRTQDTGMRISYTFRGESGSVYEAYMPRFTFFGYRYISITATDTVELKKVVSMPVTSIKKEMEIGSIETGVEDVNRLISNIYWGQLSNYLSVPTDCPQRNERLGWSADTQVFCEAGAFNADTRSFFHKWMRDLVDIQHSKGGFMAVAPAGSYGSEPMRLGWADAGIIVPYQIWKMFSDTTIIRDNWEYMNKFMVRVNESRYRYDNIAEECFHWQYADWLSYEQLESAGGSIMKDGKLRPEAIVYWDYLGACYWCWDALMMSEMAGAIGADANVYLRMAQVAKDYIRKRFFNTTAGLPSSPMDGMQTPLLFALKLGLLEGKAYEVAGASLRQNFAEHGGCLQTGFLGTSILMETLSANAMNDVAYTLLLQHKNPSWLYSVDQGATTIWERWNSYTKEKGFGPVAMNSFNHYAYGAVLAWMYKDMAGIAADPKAPGFKNIIMSPKPDRRIGFVKANYKSVAGLIKSEWRYEGDKWTWKFTVPDGSTASVLIPGETEYQTYQSGEYTIVRFESDKLSKSNGETWYDEAGYPINAHGGGVLSYDGCYYLYGEHKVYGVQGNRAHVGVHMYSSKDLRSWKDEGIVLAVENNIKSDIADGSILERPKIIHNAKTGKFVMYFHLERASFAGYDDARVGIAVADSPTGPYRFIQSLNPTPGTYPVNAREEEMTPQAMEKSKKEWLVSLAPSEEGRKALIYPACIARGQDSRDMTLFVDDDCKAYLIHSSERNSTLHFAELTDDYLEFSGRWWRVAEKDWTEAPAICKKDGWYYLIGSGCTGWDPNAARYYRAKKITGPWQRMGNPCQGVNPKNGKGPDLTWGAQSNYILKVSPSLYLAMFDIWNPTNQIDSRLVWLPISFGKGEITIPWRESNLTID